METMMLATQITTTAVTTPTVTTTQPDRLPPNALNLARRIRQVIGREGDGRYTFEVIAIDGRWLLAIKDAQRLEDLGDGV
jgi:hypothetical protein